MERRRDILWLSMIILSLACGCFIIVSAALAVGPKMVDPHTAAWDPNTEADLAGYYLYWRTVGGAFDDAHRATVAKSAAPQLNLLTVISTNGN